MDVEEIRYGYNVNDGDYNPHGIVGQQPEIDWDELRAFEVTNLRVHDIEYDRMLIHVERGKGGKDRDVMLSLFLLELRSDYWREARPQGWLFPWQSRVEPLSRRSLSRAFDPAKSMAGSKKAATLHSLRRSFATHLLGAETDVRLIPSAWARCDMTNVLHT